MPAALLHENIARKALKKLRNTPRYITNNVFAYDIGSQGPDLLFFYHILKFWDKDSSVFELGETVHRNNISAFFKATLQNAKKHGAAAMAWCTGFVTHYAADTTIHPYVYGVTNNDDGSENTTAHLLIESQFDTWYHREILGKKRIPRQVSCLKHISKSQKEAIAHTLSDSCMQVYPEAQLSYQKAYSCFIDMNSVIGFIYSHYKIKHYIFRLLEKIIGKPDIIIRHAPAQKLPDSDFLNLNKSEWVNPWNKSQKSDCSIPELIDMAVNNASEYLSAVIDYFNETASLEDTLKILGNNSYSSGLPVD